MENQFLSSQNGSGQSLLDRLSHLEAENKALREENARLRSSNKSTINRFEERLDNEQSLKESGHRFKTVFEQSILGKKNHWRRFTHSSSKSCLAKDVRLL